ncbi:MAG TPA: malate synthase G [Gammaproteobacteria bacterium]|nr:malate synthase G [Gammaproteobacteria bacterium]|tara:strand:+ start:2371 stop:4578 length:2208 start_codon:yes stop_codon:yes gene_type:complete
MESRIDTDGNSSISIRGTRINVCKPLYELVTNEVLPDLGISESDFWRLLEEVIIEMAPKNNRLLLKRHQLQAEINTWHQAHCDAPHDPEGYKNFLKKIGYLVPEGGDFSITTKNVDDEIAKIAGPQLVVPVNNARYALNAANARWGSLYDALYGSDIIPESEAADIGNKYNPKRGAEVISFGRQLLDEIAPLVFGTHVDVTRYFVDESNLAVVLLDGTVTGLVQPEKFVGYNGRDGAPSEILLCNHNLHAILQIDRNHPIGAIDVANIKDIVLESAVTTIQDCEDSVAAVDGEDKSKVYSNWLGLMRGDLSESFVKDGTKITRQLNPDRKFLDPLGQPITLPGRSMLLVRNVGHLMTTDAVLVSGQEVPEGILDAVITATIALYDLKQINNMRNSRCNSMYIVKPKMHGPEEVAFACGLFAKVEDVLGLARHTLKIGIMDEERRTTANLKECIRVAKDRLFFINTGFLDRTGDEIHTSMEAGVMVRKADMRLQKWMTAYEDWNVDVGLACGLQGVAQIGKGMWPKPDLMREMLDTKIQHIEAGASTAWVPSPTAATLHAMHYHKILVRDRQDSFKHRRSASLDDILTIPLVGDQELSEEDIQTELDNNCQGILGYVVRWVNVGIGCSKVPDIDGVGLMEDRATLRISSQHIANWLRHNFVGRKRVLETLKRMAAVVDQQNADDSLYEPMAPDYDNSIAFQTACELVFSGVQHPSGYTEPVLHRRRIELKANAGLV